MRALLDGMREMLIAVLGLQHFHEDAIKRAKARFEAGEKTEQPAAIGTPFVPAAFVFGNLKAFKDQLDAVAAASTVQGNAKAEAFDEFSDVLHRVLKGEEHEDALGVFKTLARVGDPEAPEYWSNIDALETLARLGVQPLEETRKEDVPRIQKETPIKEDALEAFERALNGDT